MELAGVLFLVAFIAGTAAFAAHVYNGLKAEGVLPLRKTPKAKGKPTVKSRTSHARKQAARGGETVRVITAKAITTNWLARKAHRRENPKPPRRPLLHRLVFPGAILLPSPNGHHPNPAPTGGTPVTSESPHDLPDWPKDGEDPEFDREALAYRDAQRGTSTRIAGPSPISGSGGAASDFMISLTRLVDEARSGGIRQKARVNLVMGEGVTQQSAVLTQYARDLQESGLYPAHVWEPVRRAAGMLSGAAAHLTESGNAISEIARTPAGELVGKAPARDELNRA